MIVCKLFVTVVSAVADSRRIAIFSNPDVPGFAAGFSWTRDPARTSYVSTGGGGVWIPIISFSPFCTGILADTPQLPACRIIDHWTGLSAGIRQPAAATVVLFVKFVLSVISGVNSLPRL